MKKLMIAAAAVAMVGGAFAANCSYDPVAPVIKGTAWVYNWKFTGKTTVGVATRDQVIKGSQNNCSFTPGSTIGGEVVRTPGALAIQGYTYTCEPECLADYSQFKDITGDTAPDTFYITKPFKSAMTSSALAINVGNVIGKAANQFEAEGEATFETVEPAETYKLTFAGLGKYDLKNVRVSSVSGNFAGTVETPYLIKNGVCTKAIVWNCDASDYIDDDMSVAYGTWSVKYNATASKNYYNKGAIVKVPAWAIAD